MTTRALVFYEGTHTPMSGKPLEVDKAKLEAIATASNALLSSGRRIKIYLSDSDHGKISQGAAVGFVAGEFTVEQITADRLPMPGLDALVGQWGIYCPVTIADERAIAQYKNGLLKELSVGITATDEIIEISAVSMPALAGAALFSGLPEQGAYEFGLSLSEGLREIQQDRAEMQLYDVFSAFMGVLSSVRDASAEELAGRSPDDLRRNAIADLSAALTSLLQVPAPPEPTPAPEPLPSVPLFSRGDMTTENQTTETTAATPATEQFSAAQFAQMQSTIAAQAEQIEQFRRERDAGIKFSQLKAQAEKLRSDRKLTPAQVKALFGEDDQAAIARFAQPGNQELSNIEFYLKQAENNPPIQLGSALGAEPLPNQPPDPAAIEAEATRLAQNARRFGALI
ncbi:MAG TPA: hypothetical protein V6C88_17345 [Chroococcidiopsis sp.]